MKNTISRVKGSQPAPILLVANKLDLESQREVDSAEGTIFDRFLQHKLGTLFRILDEL